MNPNDLDRAQILACVNMPVSEGLLAEMLEECIKELCKAAQPRTIYRVLTVEHTKNGVRLGGLPLLGKDIALHLSGCREAVLLGATLSASVDALIRRSSVADMTKMIMYNGIANAAIEHVCNALEAEIKAKYPYPYYTERFSAGYGDFPLTQQGELVGLLDAARKIGLTVTPSQMLLPMKSVTAIMGMSHEPVKDARRICYAGSCEECPYHDDCKIRK